MPTKNSDYFVMQKSLLTAVLVWLICPAASASDFWDNWDISMSAGYGERSNPLLNSDDIKTYINVDIAWYGDRFFFDNGDIGYNLYYGENLSLNIVGQLNNERVFFGKTNTQLVSIGDVFAADGLSGGSDVPIGGEGTPPEPEPIEYEVADRNHAYEAGLEAILDGEWGQLQLSVLQDVSDQHAGQRVDVTYSQTKIHKRWLISPSVGIAWKSSSLTDYYFGVEPDESNRIVPEYTAGSTHNLFGRILFSYAINKDLFWGTAVEYERLGDKIADSPIVVNDSVLTAYTGIKYRF